MHLQPERFHVMCREDGCGWVLSVATTQPNVELRMHYRFAHPEVKVVKGVKIPCKTSGKEE